MAIRVVPLTEEDIPAAIEVIQGSFKDDPYYTWVFDRSRVRNNNSNTAMDVFVVNEKANNSPPCHLFDVRGSTV